MHGFILRGLLTILALSLPLAGAAPLAAAPGPPGGAYAVTKLVSDQPGAALKQDPNLVNGWGLARSSTSPWWVADNEKDKSSLYLADGTPLSLAPDVHGGPTGAVFAGIAGSFPVATSTITTLGPASFIFDNEDGQILAWRGGSAALVTADLHDGAIYKGLAIATTPSGPMIYAADFHNARIDVFDGSWTKVTMPAGAFSDHRLQRGYAPFGIQTIGSDIFVAYAKQDKEREDEAAGRGRGFVDEYDLAGHLVARVAQHGQLDAPWGLALAPAGWGRFGGDLLVGNFGNGQINAYEPGPRGDFRHRGTLRDVAGGKLTIDGLWALEFGGANPTNNGTPDQLFFTAGPDDESHGLFGKIETG